MKKYFLFLFTVAFFSAEAQTKQETEDWIKSKLITYFEDNFRTLDPEWATPKTYYRDKNIQVKFTDCHLIISVDQYETRYTSQEAYNNTPKKPAYYNTNKYVIPLQKLKKVDFSTRNIILATDQRSVQHYMSDDHGKTYEKRENDESAYIGFNHYGEENLEERMIKAFNHLQNYCPITKSKEAF
jgi:hypothetical protein